MKNLKKLSRQSMKMFFAGEWGDPNLPEVGPKYYCGSSQSVSHSVYMSPKCSCLRT